MQKFLLIALAAVTIPMSMPADARDSRSPALKACFDNCIAQREQRIRVCRSESARLGIGSDDRLCRQVREIRSAYGQCQAACSNKFRR